ncbi:MAG: hypothetical protein ACE5QF_08865 [Thermoplasmata archaeon]
MIAFRIGGEEGKGEVYDENGSLITAPDEKIVYRKDRVFCEIRKRGWIGFLGGKIDFLGGKGKLYVTNKRLVFIREPLRRIIVAPLTGGFPPAGAVPVPLTVKRKSKRIRRKKIKEFFQIELGEVCRVQKGLLGGYRLSIEDDEQNEYRLYVRMRNGLDRIQLRC